MPLIPTKSGIQWHYDIEGKGENLLFIHGWGVDKRIWRQQAKFFAENYRVMTIDLPGHGKSSWKKVSLEEMAHDLRMILKRFDFKDITVVGSSLGGLFALKLHEVYPELIKRIIFVGSMPKFSKSSDFPYGLDVQSMKMLGGQLKTAYPSIVNIFFRSLFTREERQSRRYKWLQKFRQADEVPMKQALIDYLEIIEKEDLREVFVKMKIPVQFINGSGDEICTKQTVEYMKQISPNSKFHDFEHCGHFPFLSKPHEFNKIMQRFLEENSL